MNANTDVRELLYNIKELRQGQKWWKYDSLVLRILVMFLQFPIGGISGFGGMFLLQSIVFIAMGTATTRFFVGQFIAFIFLGFLFGVIDYFTKRDHDSY